MSRCTCSGGRRSTSNSSFWMYSSEGVNRTTVGFVGNDAARAASLGTVVETCLRGEGIGWWGKPEMAEGCRYIRVKGVRRTDLNALQTFPLCGIVVYWNQRSKSEIGVLRRLMESVVDVKCSQRRSEASGSASGTGSIGQRITVTFHVIKVTWVSTVTPMLESLSADRVLIPSSRPSSSEPQGAGFKIQASIWIIQK